MPTSLHICRLDLADPRHRHGLVTLLDEYARGHAGNGTGVPADALARLPAALAATPHYLGWLAFVDGEPVGLANCFIGFSTFRAQPLINIHDMAVTRRLQRQGIGRQLLAAIADEARARGCCKITLEVLSGNLAAIAAYRQAGFEPYGLDPAMGSAQFYEQKLY